MPTLNVKNFPETIYRKLKTRARQQRRSVAQEVTHILAAALAQPRLHSISELRGLGREHWASVDAADHVDRERRAWD